MTKAELERRPLVIACLGLLIGLTAIRNPVNLLFLLPFPWLLPALSQRALLVGAFLVGVILGPGQPPSLLADREFVDSNWQVASLPKLTPFGQQCEIERSGTRLLMSYGNALPL